MSKDLLAQYSDLVILFFDPLVVGLDSTEGQNALIQELGYILPENTALLDGIQPTIDLVYDVVDSIDIILDKEEVKIGDLIPLLKDLVVNLGAIFDKLKNLSSDIQNGLNGTSLLNDTDILQKLPVKLIQYLFIKFLEDHYASTYTILTLAGVITEKDVLGDEANISEHTLKEINWDQFENILKDPFNTVLGEIKDNEGVLFEKLVFLLSRLGESLGLFTEVIKPDFNILGQLNSGGDLTVLENFEDLESLVFPLTDLPNINLELELFPLVDLNSKKFNGVGVMLTLGGEVEIPLSDDYKIVISSSDGVSSGLGIAIKTDGSIDFINNITTAPSNISANPPGLKIALRSGTQKIETIEDNFFSIGSPEGSRLDIGMWELALGFDFKEKVRFYLETQLLKGNVVINFGDADGFVSKIAGTGIEGNFDLGIGFSNIGGLYFKGSAGLNINLPTHIELGPIEIQFLTMGLLFKDGHFPLTIGATLAANLGPLKAVVENIGLEADFHFPVNGDGNLGPINVSPGFKPPNGIGLSIDAGVVKGGGYLFFDFDREEYAGALELVISEWIAVKAIGLITTKMPDGSKGFSLLIIVTAEFGTGIQLGFGFTLLAVGGLLGLNRTVKIQPLAEGVRTGSVNSVMFPEDVVANAPRIISDLKQFFPVQEKQFLIGPMAKIGYGTPPLISLSLGVIIEFPNVNITILGVLKATLPDENAEVLKLQVNFIGRIEPSNKLLWFYAELFDSRILFLTIEGGMGLLVNWGDQSNFVLSVGGFHPRYNPPPLPFPEPPRLAINLLNESWAKIRIEGYFAVTSNTVQFGARVEVFFGVSAFNIDGHFGFDALFQFDPFYFIFELSLSLSVKLFGMGLFSVGFKGLLEGPTPWHIKGKGKISFFLFSVSVPFEETWGEERHTELPPIEILPLIEREFKAITNWEAIVPVASNIMVTLRELDESTAGTASNTNISNPALVLHPVGKLRISQRKMPLNLELDKIGNQRPSDVNKISLAAKITGGGNLTTTYVKEKFAAGEFRDLNESSKLSSPGFELYDAGVEVKSGDSELKTSMAVKRVIRYETIIIDNNFKRHQIPFFKLILTSFTGLFATLFGHFLKGNAVTKSTQSESWRKKMQPSEALIQVLPNFYSVADNKTNKPIDPVAMAFTSQASAIDYMREQIREDPGKAAQMHVIPNTEINPAA